MIYEKETIIKYRIDRALETLEEAKILSIGNHWNTVANRLYFACFYIVIALLFKNSFRTKSHSGARTTFSNEFIKTGLVIKDLGVLYGNLFNKRQEGDYEDVKIFTKEEIEPLISEVEKFIIVIRELIGQ
jgi:uncharacterized protein (UPF0332 family)